MDRKPPLAGCLSRWSNLRTSRALCLCSPLRCSGVQISAGTSCCCRCCWERPAPSRMGLLHD